MKATSLLNHPTPLPLWKSLQFAMRFACKSLAVILRGALRKRLSSYV